MTDYAVIDIGSNSVRYGEEVQGRFPVKEVYTTRLGSGLADTGRLAEQTMASSLDVIKRLAERARENGLVPAAYATSAVRDAENGRDFAKAVEQAAGVPVEILSGEEEARFAFIGAVPPGSPCNTMLDIGGASMQVVQEGFAVSFPAGCVRCGDIARNSLRLDDCDAMWQIQRMVVEGYMDGLMELPELDITGLVGVGGTITTLAALHAGLSEFDPKTVSEVVMTKRDISALIGSLASMGGAKRAEHPLLRQRHDVILYGAYILHHALDRLNAGSINVSCSDGMEGYLWILKQRNERE